MPALIPFHKRVRYLPIKIPVRRISRCLRRLRAASLTVTCDHLASHFLAGGDMENVTDGMLVAHEKSLHLPWLRACAIDLATRVDPGGAVRLGDLVRSAVTAKAVIIPPDVPFEFFAAGTRCTIRTLDVRA